MASQEKKSVGVYEGYQVFTNDVKPEVKQEPVDPEFDKDRQPEVDVEGGGSSSSVRDLLKQMVENKNKELTVKNVVENLLAQNEVLLAQSDAQAYKPNPRTVKPKNTEQVFESHGSILTPKDPTELCTKEDMPNINDALVEVCVNEANKTKCDLDLVCAVGSKIILLTPQGQPLQMDITYYWCNFCSYKSENKATLLQHVMEHRFHCKHCKFQSFSRAAVIHHCTEEHDSFTETATTLKYCTYLPDLLKNNELKKRKKGITKDTPPAKRARVEDTETLNMEVEEIDSTETSAGVSKMIKPSFASAGKETHAVKKSDNNGLPVISSVISGHKALTEALTPPKTQPTQPKPTPPPEPCQAPTSITTSNLTVSSGLCWNCGYCGFVTLSQSFLKIHLNAQHPGKAHKYVAMLVSSEEELIRIKALDAQLVTDASGGSTKVQVTPIKLTDLPSSTLTSPSSSTPTPVSKTLQSKVPTKTLTPPAEVKKNTQAIEINNSESEIPKIVETEEEKRIPVSYKCAHCNFSYPKEDKVKIHLFQRHSGCVIYALDMKAVKLRQKRYIFFCLKTKCSFKTKDTEEYLEHIRTCTPWLDGTERENVDAVMVKSLELTKTFIEKTANGLTFGKDSRVDRSAEYVCIYCSYNSNNNTRLKKHVMTNHADKSCIIMDIPASKTNKRSLVYFCNFCLWETREGSVLEMHLAERHNAVTKTSPANTPAAPYSDVTSQSKEKKQSVAQEKSFTKEKEEPFNMEKNLKKKTSPAQSKKRQTHDKSRERNTPSPEEKEYKSENDDTENDDETDENEFTGLVPSADYEKAMAEYLHSENLEPKKGRGRPSRKSAVKCRMKVKSLKAPPLYKCLSCSQIYFGAILMRRHIRKEHKDQPLKAIDILKQHRKNPNFYALFCPSDKCKVYESFPNDLINHAKYKHGLAATNVDLAKITNAAAEVQTSLTSSSKGRPSTAATGESYECLYCTASKLYHSRKDMKFHLIEEHNGEEFIYRDCISRKLRQPSRYYMCHNVSCDFTSEKQKDYLLHMLGHQKATIFECSKCQWFTSVSGEINNHFASVHTGEDVTSLKIELDLDNLGNTVKLIDGIAIKKER